MELSPLVIALTGSIGSGKSTIGAMLERRGVTIIDADQLAREVVTPQKPAFQAVVKSFGANIVDSASGELNRKLLGEIIFADPAKRRTLESILHPEIRALFLAKLTALKKNPSPAPWIIGYLIPLLFESGADFRKNYREFDLIVVVSTTTEKCIERIVARDGASRETAERRLASQLSNAEKESKADIVVRNDGTRSELEEAVDILFKKLTNRFETKQSSTNSAPS